jgi:hypothetical protein
VFVDPSPEGISKVTGFLSKEKVPLILGFVGAILVLIGLITFLYVSFPYFFLSSRCFSLIFWCRILRKRRKQGRRFNFNFGKGKYIKVGDAGKRDMSDDMDDPWTHTDRASPTYELYDPYKHGSQASSEAPTRSFSRSSSPPMTPGSSAIDHHQR